MEELTHYQDEPASHFLRHQCRCGSGGGAWGGRGGNFEGHVAAAEDAAAVGFAERFSGGDGAEHVEERGVGGDLQIEVESAVDEDSGAAEEGGDGKRAGCAFGPIFELGGGAAEELYEEPKGD